MAEPLAAAGRSDDASSPGRGAATTPSRCSSGRGRRARRRGARAAPLRAGRADAVPGAGNRRPARGRRSMRRAASWSTTCRRRSTSRHAPVRRAGSQDGRQHFVAPQGAPGRHAPPRGDGAAAGGGQAGAGGRAARRARRSASARGRCGRGDAGAALRHQLADQPDDRPCRAGAARPAQPPVTRRQPPVQAQPQRRRDVARAGAHRNPGFPSSSGELTLRYQSTERAGFDRPFSFRVGQLAMESAGYHRWYMAAAGFSRTARTMFQIVAKSELCCAAACLTEPAGRRGPEWPASIV